MQLWSRIPAEERQGVEEVLQQLLQGEYPNRHQNHWLTRSGEARFIAWTNTVLRDREGGVRSLIATGIDITEHKREDEERIRRLEAEIERMEGFSAAGENVHSTLSSHTARSYAQHSYREARPEAFSRLRKHYAELLADRMEERSYKTEARAARRLQRLTEELGREAAGPRDVVELHVAALKEMSNGTSYKRAQVLMEEGRLMALELMGNLVAFYRNQVVRGEEG
jgi:hypothetical protein